MRLLLIHNFYKSNTIGGEDVVFREESQLLKKELGNDNVHIYSVYNDHSSPVALFVNSFFSIKHYVAVRRIIKKENIQIMHVHNFFPLLSLSIYFAARKSGVKVVQTLHNYRIWCIAGTLYRKNKICEVCVSKSYPLTGIFSKCYRGSVIQSVVTQVLFWLYRDLRFFKKVDAFFVLTEFQKKKVQQFGIDNSIVFIKPNIVSSAIQNHGTIRSGYIYIGRFEGAKGVETLLEQWLTLDLKFHLTLIGEGVDYERCRDKYSRLNITFMGKQERDRTQYILGCHKYLIQPSLWYETFGLTIIEAMSKGIPVIGTNIGTRKELIQDGKNGFLYEKDTFNQVIELSHSYPNYEELVANCKESSKQFLPDLILSNQLQIYRNLIL